MHTLDYVPSFWIGEKFYERSINDMLFVWY